MKPPSIQPLNTRTPENLNPDYDLAIVGSGFGGAVLAMIARRLGLSVLLLERGIHPRFAIGESTSPLMNLLIEQLAHRYDLPRLLPLTSHGPWQRAYSDVVCGLKRGFTYYHHEAGKPFRAAPDRSDQLLVAASPNDELSDMHWLRSDVDMFLVQEAIALGADYLDKAQIEETSLDRSRPRGRLAEGPRDGSFIGPAPVGATSALVGQTSAPILLRGTQGTTPFQVKVRLVVDATGPRGFLSRALGLAEATFPGYPPTQSLYTHFTDVHRTETLAAFQTPGAPPYSPDDAALHHVFDGGWMWVLCLNNGITSAGFAVTDALAAELALSEGEPAWPRFLRRFPTIGEQFADARPTRPFVYAPRLSYRCSVAAGDGWVMLPSAAAFIDPLFSTGMPLTLLGIERLGRIFAESWDTDALPARLQEYGEITLAEADWAAQFIAACYAAMPQFPLFSAFSMFYFAAASFSEMARRLDKAHLVRRFLAADHPAFSAGLRSAADRLRCQPSALASETRNFENDITAAIEPLNIAGLSDSAKRNWYDIDLNDLIRNAHKLALTPDTMREILATAPWAQV